MHKHEEIRKELDRIFAMNIDVEFPDIQTAKTELLALFQSHEAQIKQDIFKKVEGILTEGIDKEIDWCKNAPDENITEEDRLSFIEGLIQANRIIYKVLKALEEEELK